MNKLFLLLAIVSSLCCSAQDAKDNYSNTVKTLDSTLETLYEVISGEKGEARDWELFKYLFKPEAKLIPINRNKEGKDELHYRSPDDYIKTSGKWLVDNGFFEKEIHRVTQHFGSMTHVFSTYESYRSASDAEPFSRGINSIQLLNDGQRWWVVNIYWSAEREDQPIPKQYLPASN